MAKIINFGSLNIDYVYKVSHTVRPGETLAGKERLIGVGGKGANQSVALAKAGARVLHIGNLGPEGGFLAEKLAHANVDISGIRTLETPSGHAIIQLAENGQNAIILFGGANHALTPEQIDDALNQAEPGDIVLLQNETNLVGEIIRRAHARNLPIAFNFAPFSPEAARELPLELVTYLMVNETEAEGLTQATTPETVFARLRERFPRAVGVITWGKEGAYVPDADGAPSHAPTIEVKVVDTTAAGDTFNAYFLAGVLEKMDYPAAARLGCAAAAITVSRLGAADSIPCRSEVKVKNI